jgi:hypothetical protein
VGADHTLHMKVNAFWSTIGNPIELVVPLYILLAALRKAYARTQPELHKRMSDATQLAARRYSKALKQGTVQPITGYHRKILAERYDSGHLPLEAFLKHAMEAHAEARVADGDRLQAIYATWDEEEESAYDTFYAMVRCASATIDERRILELFETSLEPASHLVRHPLLLDDLLTTSSRSPHDLLTISSPVAPAHCSSARALACVDRWTCTVSTATYDVPT